jgi:hypothetical protein
MLFARSVYTLALWYGAPGTRHLLMGGIQAYRYWRDVWDVSFPRALASGRIIITTFLPCRKAWRRPRIFHLEFILHSVTSSATLHRITPKSQRSISKVEKLNKDQYNLYIYPKILHDVSKIYR